MTTDAGIDVRGLGEAPTLAEFRKRIRPLSPEERDLIVGQALVLIDQLYVHLPLKRAMHAVDPVQRLRLLRRRVSSVPDTLSERQFHDEMMAIFVGLRDLHTRYTPPAPYRGSAALPFRVQEFFEDGTPRYVVTDACAALIEDPRLRVGAFVTHWNGVAMDRAVELNADRQPGSNWDARHARGVNTMTKRPLETSALPDEDWVYLGCQDGDDGSWGEARIEWRVIKPKHASTAVDPRAPEEPLARGLGIDVETEAVRRSRKTVFMPEEIETEHQVAKRAADRRVEPGDEPPGMEGVSLFPDALEFGSRRTSHGEFGYLRIRTFLVREGNFFLAEVMRILELVPKDGLIVDVRGNPGGVIANGERLLQLFTPRRIEPEPVHFINTPLTQELCGRLPELEPWEQAIARGMETAATFSDGFSMTRAEDCNALGQYYHGPVLLIMDALCYSATDIFIAGWRDHGIGPILGTSRNTGAGGANVWEHGDLVKSFTGADSPIEPLPKEASFSLAIRRTTRVADRAGDPLEDLGVAPDDVHELTLNDLLHDNHDLLERAGEMLSELPLRALAVGAARSRDGTSASLTITSRGISRLDAYVDDRPWGTRDVVDGATTLEIPVGPARSRLELQGFHGDDLVAARRLIV